jgi:Amt family ammonium transporter
LIGIVSGVVCYFAVNLKNRLGWDDALDVWGVHGVGGILGVFFLGLFATKTMNATGANGLFYGDPGFFFKEVIAVVGFAVYAFVFSYLALMVIDKFVPVKTTKAEESMGLDAALHGEEAYIA